MQSPKETAKAAAKPPKAAEETGDTAAAQPKATNPFHKPALASSQDPPPKPGNPFAVPSPKSRLETSETHGQQLDDNDDSDQSVEASTVVDNQSAAVSSSAAIVSTPSADLRAPEDEQHVPATVSQAASPTDTSKSPGETAAEVQPNCSPMRAADDSCLRAPTAVAAGRGRT